MTTRTVGIADLQRKARRVLDDIQKTKQPYLVLSRNIPKAVLLDIHGYDRLHRELTKFREEARIVEQVRRAEQEITNGKSVRGKLETILATI